jgi:peroxiredoxin
LTGEADSMTEFKTPEIGEIAPDFELPDSLGVVHRLSDEVAARPLVLLFFRGPW